jgi:predicted AAA+ superfamily ATPase
MIKRRIHSYLAELASYYPVVVLTGPRQSGKTTLSQQVFSEKTYISLEPIDTRSYATEDPRGFLDEYKQGAIIDEVQHAPDLLSYIQDFVDKHPEPGRFILTGSQNFMLSQSISQSLAGRCGVLTLLPPDWSELQQFDNTPEDLFSLLWQGQYPRIYDREIPAQRWLSDYVTTYVQRDVRQITQVGDLNAFTTFLKLCAGSTGQEINLSRLGNDTGISHNTAKAWLSVLETAWLTSSLPAWHKNIRKQVIKAPKLHFIDTGLVCFLLGIRSAEELRHHPLRGAIFESWVASEILKDFTNQGRTPMLYHYREPRGLEIDLIIESAEKLHLMEIKSGATISSSFFNNLAKFRAQHSNISSIDSSLIYAGSDNYRRQDTQVISWNSITASLALDVSKHPK